MRHMEKVRKNPSEEVLRDVWAAIQKLTKDGNNPSITEIAEASGRGISTVYFAKEWFVAKKHLAAKEGRARSFRVLKPYRTA
jgi:hypothetical protein